LHLVTPVFNINPNKGKVYKMLKKALIFSLASFLLLLFMIGCSDNEPAAIMPPPSGENLTELPPIWDIPHRPEPANFADELTSTNLLQLTPLTPGELLATMHTSMGDITIRFFPTESPIAVENFLTHAWDGYYDGISFHRVMPNFMIQGGCPDGTGMAGESIWGHGFGHELSAELRHFRGALAMAQSAAPNSKGSQFYFVQNNNLGADFRNQFTQLIELQDEEMQQFPDGSIATVGDVYPYESLRYFIDNGGTPHLDWHFSDNPHTVFGHVVSGMDIVDAIANVETEGGGNANPFQHRPVDPVTILGFTFFLYGGE